jgi:hypothetical protein
MAITVSGTTITFNDATTQTTAAGAAPTAGNGITVTSGVIALGVPSNSSVGTYTAATPFTAIGTQGTDYTIGTTIAGSDLYILRDQSGGRTRYMIYKSLDASAQQSMVTASLSGTWKAVARVKGFRDICCQTDLPAGMWIRTA